MDESSLFKPLPPFERLGEKVLEQVKKLIDGNVIKVGDRLPSERDLARQFSVSRTSVREALRTLEALGIVETRVGAGSYIVSRVATRSLLSDRNWMAALQGEDILKFYELREALESKAAALAARRATEEDIRCIRLALDKMVAAIQKKDVVLAVLGDIEFHDCISEATKNPFFVNLSHLINRQLLEIRYLRLENMSKAQESIQDHAIVLNAIIAKDSDTAAMTMMYHLRRATTDFPEFIGKVKESRPDQDQIMSIVQSLGE